MRSSTPERVRVRERLHRKPSSPGTGGVRALVAWMLVAIVGVGVLAFLDSRREEQSALDDFADDQAWLADALSRAIAERLQRTARDAEGRPVSIPDLVASVRSFERPREVRVFLQPPGHHDFVEMDGSTIEVPVIDRALRDGRRSVTLQRSEAGAVDLPARMAMAGLALVDAGERGRWGVVVLATAQSERDREIRARARLLLAIVLASGLVIAFGGLAVRVRTKELELRHALTLGEVEAERDERLGQADKIATMGALAIGIAHQVSTPLSVILARAEQIARRKSVDERVKHFAEVIVKETERIDEVIRGLLALVRGEEARLERTDPNALAADIITLVEHRFAKAGVLLETRFAVVPEIECDRRLFGQVLANLLLNACEACERGGRVAIATRRDASSVAFVVTDDGKGIADDGRERVLEPFFTTKKEGTGLGLAIAAELVKHHRGSLQVRRRGDGPGTIAVVTLPAPDAEESPEASS